MKLVLFLIVSLCFLGQDATAQSIQEEKIGKKRTSAIGLAYYALMSPMWPCSAVRGSEHNLNEFNIATLWNTFGQESECLKRYLADPRLKSIEFHLINEVCHRNGNCGAYEFLRGIDRRQYRRLILDRDPQLFARFTEYVKPLQKLLEQNLKPATQCLISPGLESNLPMDAAKILVHQVSSLFPNCTIVWNPVNKAQREERIDNTIFEEHHHRPTLPPLKSRCILNLDGQDIDFPARPAILPKKIKASVLPEFLSNDCLISFLWLAEFNGIKQGPFLDPRERDNFPTLQLMELLLERAGVEH